MVASLCRGFQSLPEAGGVMDQPVWVLRMFAVLAAAEGEGDSVAPADTGPAGGLAAFQTVTG